MNTFFVSLFGNLEDLIYENRLRRNCLSLKNTHKIHHIKAHSEESLISALDHLQNKTIEFVLISGHGNPEEIILGKDFYLQKNSCVLMKKLAEKINDKAILVLDSCSTGKGPQCIAKTLSTYCPTAIVYGPDDNFSPIGSRLICPPSYRPDYQASSKETSGFLKIQARAYQNGFEKL